MATHSCLFMWWTKHNLREIIVAHRIVLSQFRSHPCECMIVMHRMMFLLLHISLWLRGKVTILKLVFQVMKEVGLAFAEKWSRNCDKASVRMKGVSSPLLNISSCKRRIHVINNGLFTTMFLEQPGPGPQNNDILASPFLRFIASIGYRFQIYFWEPKPLPTLRDWSHLLWFWSMVTRAAKILSFRLRQNVNKQNI